MKYKLLKASIFYRPSSTLLSMLLLVIGTGIISFILMVSGKLENQFSNDVKNIDMVIGAKGSPLQLILSAVYHIDVPTGNIDKQEAGLLAANPLLSKVIPLAYGDSYQGFSIVGTDTSYLGNYEARCETGKVFSQVFDVVIGNNVARITGLKPGDHFFGTHGATAGGHVHKAFAYTVTGILQHSSSVLDNLVITPVESVWKMHEHHHAADDQDTGGDDDDEASTPPAVLPGGTPDSTAREPEKKHEASLTALLVQCKTPMATLTLPRMINETTHMQAAVPSIEINRMFSLLGIGIAGIQGIAITIMVISGFSIFIALFNRLKEHRYALALMRSMGSSRWQLFFQVIAEGCVLSITGCITGLLLARLGLWLIDITAAADFHMHFFQWALAWPDGLLILVAAVMGFLASLLPAVRAFHINIAQTLSHV